MTALPDTPASNTFFGDVVHERAHALMDAVSLAREALCESLEPDGTDALVYKDAVPKVSEAWQDFQVVVALAQRQIERSGRG